MPILDKDTEEIATKMRLWAVAMSEEMSEILKDYRNY